MGYQDTQPQYQQAGGQNVFKGGAGPVQGAPHGAYAPAPYPNNGYPAQPVPGYPAGESGMTQHQRREGCCNSQWVLFGFGWVTGLTWILGFLLPMCSYQRLKVPSYRVGWYANTIMTALSVGVGIAMIYFYGNVCAWGPNGYRCNSGH